AGGHASRPIAVGGPAAPLELPPESPPTTDAPAPPPAAPSIAAPPTTKPRKPKVAPLPAQLASARLERFSSCPELETYARTEAAKVVGPDGLPGVWAMATSGQSAAGTPGGSVSQPSAMASTAASDTNVQEPGVDEPDIVKNNGHQVFALAQNELWITTFDGDPRLLSTLTLADQLYPNGLLLVGDRLIVIG